MVAGPAGDDAAAEAPPEQAGDRGSGRSRLALPLLVLLLALPLVVALVALHEPRWYPTVDDAQTELRVRDVWTENPPLTGLGGRIGVFGPDQGSHPGPLSFWSLSIFYRLLGADSWALQAATAALHVIAMGLALWMARRRGGLPLLVGVAAVLAVLAQAYGAYALTTPWNPYMPMLWWFLFVLGVWSLLCGDLAVLPVAVFAGSFCMQTHISYLGLVSALAGLSTLAVGAWLFIRWRDREARRRCLVLIGLGVALGAVLWFPPVAEQITKSQGGNFGEIAEHFSDPPEEPLGLGEGLDLVLANLDPWDLLTEPAIDDRPFLGGPTGPGVLLLAAWAAAVLVAGWLRHRTLLRLHLLLAGVLVVAVVSTSRIFGAPWTYLALWTWSICALLVLATAWSACALVARLAPEASRPRLAKGVLVGAAALFVASTTRSTIDASDAEVFQPELSQAAATLVPQTVEALEDPATGDGRDGRYLVTWNDPIYGGARGFTMFNELDREGFDVGGPRFLRAALTRHRVLTPEQATAQVHVTTGADIEVWQDRPDYRQIASYESGPGGRAEWEQLRSSIDAELEALGRDELRRLVEEAPTGLIYQSGLPDELREQIDRLIEIGPPVAVFVGPPLPEG